MDVQALVKQLTHANHIYRTTSTPIMSDEEYDILIEQLEEMDPDNDFLKEIGTEVGKVKLKYHMGSMNKIKDAKLINQWVAKHPGEKYVISDKLDGSSALLLIEPGIKQLLSRGNGDYGRDISHLIEFLNIPDAKDEKDVRGELVVSKTNFAKYKDKYSSPRNMANAIMTSKTIDPLLASHLEFIVFDSIEPNLPPSEAFPLLMNQGFNIPNVTATHSNELSYDFLYNTLMKHKANTDYEIDGIIITLDKVNELTTTGNPKHSFAYKSNQEGILTEITDIIYKTTKHGKLNPTILFKPIKINGSMVKAVNGQSGKYIVKHTLNIGSKIKVILSGEVIPYITEIVEHSNEPKLPDTPFTWDKNNVNIYSTELEDSTEYMTRRLVSFFKTLKIEFLSTGLILKLIENKYDTIHKIITMTEVEFLTLDGFKETLANKVYHSIHGTINVPIPPEKLMTASLCFKNGFSEKRFKMILKMYPHLLESNVPPSLEEMNAIPGFSGIISKQFIENYPHFITFLDDHPMLKWKRNTKKLVKKYLNQKTESMKTESMLKDKNIVITGFRDESIITFIEDNGGTITNTVNKKTHLVIVPDAEYKNKKIEKAQELSIPIKTKEGFIHVYLVSNS
jgi:DNA ligase (NAD+)